jgi:hypothetical protein
MGKEPGEHPVGSQAKLGGSGLAKEGSVILRKPEE